MTCRRGHSLWEPFTTCHAWFHWMWQVLDPGATWPHTILNLDQPMRRLGCELGLANPEERDNKLLLHLHRDGFVRVEDFAAYGVDMDELVRQALQALSQRGRAHATRHPLAWISSYSDLPALQPLLESPALAHVIHGYLGGSARYDGHVTFRIADGLETDEYLSGYWHHDRCGRRIRLGIFLHDVWDDGRPTLVARGSQNNLYFSYLGHGTLTRYTDSFVRSRYAVTALTGKRGGGFLLDTNALHTGQLKGNRSRSVIFLEFHPHSKVPMLHRDSRGKDMPCPSRRPEGQDGTPSPDDYWRLGRPGYALYPVDADLNVHGGGTSSVA